MPKKKRKARKAIVDHHRNEMNARIKRHRLRPHWIAWVAGCSHPWLIWFLNEKRNNDGQLRVPNPSSEYIRNIHSAIDQLTNIHGSKRRKAYAEMKRDQNQARREAEDGGEPRKRRPRPLLTSRRIPV